VGLEREWSWSQNGRRGLLEQTHWLEERSIVIGPVSVSTELDLNFCVWSGF
jgi:hypothetical protein